MRKAQIQSQLFIYILTIIVIGVLLLFGIKWIGKILQTDEVVQQTAFVKDIEGAFNSIRSDYGSQRLEEFSAPGSVDRTCFVDSQTTATNAYGLCNPEHSDYDPIMCNAWRDKTSSVLFSPPFDSSVDLGKIVVEGHKYLCFDNTKNKLIRLKLTGLGDKVKVSEQ